MSFGCRHDRGHIEWFELLRQAGAKNSVFDWINMGIKSLRICTKHPQQDKQHVKTRFNVDLYKERNPSRALLQQAEVLSLHRYQIQ